VHQERLDRFDLQIRERQVGHRALPAIGDEAKQQTQRVTIRSNRMGTRPTHSLQVIAKEGLDQRQQPIISRATHFILRAD
jgi:hypothetical protein